MHAEIKEQLIKAFPGKTEFSPRHVRKVLEPMGYSEEQSYEFISSFPRVRKGVYNLGSLIQNLSHEPDLERKPLPIPQQALVNPITEESDSSFVPTVDPCYIPWGNSKTILSIIKSGMFYPTYITGLSGNGKTIMVEQSCAKLKRSFVRVQVNPETDEDDLIGGFRLQDGETVFAKGPVIQAMESGSILLIDEIDRGTNKIMCLQGILEGKPVLIKKTGELVHPQPGFNVIATANTKGQGSDDGKFIAASILDEAFLERFVITLEQQYPTLSIERKILTKQLGLSDEKPKRFIEDLVKWSETIRKTYEDGGIDDTISTRRLAHIVKTYKIFGKEKQSIELCTNRFDEEIKTAFLDLYEKIKKTETPIQEVSPFELTEEQKESINKVFSQTSN